MTWRFSDTELENLRHEIGLPLARLRSLLASRDALSGFNVSQLKTLIRFIKHRARVHLNVTGNKEKLMNSIANVLFASDGSEDNSRENVTIEHNVHLRASQPASMQQLIRAAASASSIVVKDAAFEEGVFMSRQSPYYESKKLFLTHPFERHDTEFQSKYFAIDNNSIYEIRSGSRALHVRFFSKERGGDIPWNVDVRLRVNGNLVDLTKFARKIRCKSFSNPYVLPRPVDISPYIKSSNTIEFCHPGECGVVVVQMVRERTLLELEKSVGIGSDDMQEEIDLNVTPMENEVEEVNYMLSMRCPLSYQRIQTPVKSRYCKHAQCFDLKSFVEYCHQQQLWQCPVCFQQSPFKDLVRDESFEKILHSVGEDTMQVIMHTDGTFSVPSPSDKKDSPSPLPIQARTIQNEEFSPARSNREKDGPPPILESNHRPHNTAIHSNKTPPGKQTVTPEDPIVILSDED